MLYDKCLEMSYKNSLTSDQNIVPNFAIVPNIDRQSYKTSIYRGSTGRHFKQYLLIGADAVSSVHHNHGHNSCHLWHGRTMPRLCTISDRVRVNTKSTIMIVQKATIIYNLNSNHLFFRVHHTMPRLCTHIGRNNVHWWNYYWKSQLI